MECDLDCPYGEPYCCRACQSSRRYLKDAHPEKWNDETGFRSDKGCKLDRNEMPQLCKDYDCKNYVFYSTMSFEDGQWMVVGCHEILKEKKNRVFVDKYNMLFKELRNGS